MTLNIIPPTMRARHHETGEWHTLVFSHVTWHWNMPATECFYIDTGDEPIWADLHDFDSFEGAVS